MPATLDPKINEMANRLSVDCLDDLYAFVRRMWPVIEPGTMLDENWHIGVICDELMAVARGETKELVICVPPGTLKSVLVSVMFPCWWWLREPHRRGIHISNSDRLCVRDSRRAADIIRSGRYQRCVNVAHEQRGLPLWKLSKGQQEKVNFANTRGGFRLSIPTNARVTGDRGNYMIFDDPIDAQEAVTGTPEQIVRRMVEVQHKYDHVWASRRNDLRSDPRITIMQRLAPHDLAGVLLERGVKSVVLPMEWDGAHPHRYAGDPRTKPNELLFPHRFPRSEIDELKSKDGAARHYVAQYQQQPPPLGGGVFDSRWFRYYSREVAGDHVYYVAEVGDGMDPERVRSDQCFRLITTDQALTKSALADYSVIQAWDVHRRDGRMFLLDQWRGQVQAPDYKLELTRMVDKHAPAWIGAEYTTASKAIVDDLVLDGMTVKKLKPSDYGGDKVTRATTAAIHMEGGKVFFPRNMGFVTDLEAELMLFPGVEHDDQVDTLVWGVLASKGSTVPSKAHYKRRPSG